MSETVNIKWAEDFNIHRAQVGMLSLVVAWNGQAPKNSPQGYVVSINGTSKRQAKKLYRDLDEAKNMAIRMAWRAVEAMKEDIDALVTPQKPTATANGAAGEEFMPPLPRDEDETRFDKGYNAGYEEAAKVAREQYALVNIWIGKVVDLQAENERLLKFIKDFVDCDYKEHGDYVKARELEILQERAENLVAEIEGES